MNGQTREAPYPPYGLVLAMANAAPTPVVLIARASGIVLYANRMGALLAHDPAAVVSLPARQAFPAPIVAGLDEVRRSGQAAQLKSLFLPPAPHRAEVSVWDIDCTPMPGATNAEMPCILLTGHDVTPYVHPRREAVATVYDVTERQRQQDALSESQDRLKFAIEAGGLATWEIDIVNGVTTMDAGFSKLLGLPAETFQGSRDEGRSFIHPDDIDSARAALEAAIATKGQLKIETRTVAADGRIVGLAYTGRVVADNDGKPLRVAGVVRDVTERRAREDMLREAMESRELLAREADHRIKNSLQLICTILTLQMMQLTTPDVRAALEDAISRVQAVAEAHRALHQSADLQTVDFGAMLGDLCRHATKLSPAITFTCECSMPIDLDTERAIPLGLLISELLTNAAKYAYVPEGGPVAVSATLAEGEIVIRVVDRGRGMPEESRRGSGIGSKIIGAIARRIGARVETASGPGGTAVAVSFAHHAADRA
jgi:PAS domain S-box-containing protein